MSVNSTALYELSLYDCGLVRDSIVVLVVAIEGCEESCTRYTDVVKIIGKNGVLFEELMEKLLSAIRKRNVNSQVFREIVVSVSGLMRTHQLVSQSCQDVCEYFIGMFEDDRAVVCEDASILACCEVVSVAFRYANDQ